MGIKSKLNELGLNQENAIVIGSGILDALGIRDSKDIDVVVTEDKYNKLSESDRFRKEQNHGCEVLTDDLFEIRTIWNVVGKTWRFNDLLSHSMIINGVRYITIEFLLDVKRCWLKDRDVRKKDVDDVRLMENYLDIQKE